MRPCMEKRTNEGLCSSCCPKFADLYFSLRLKDYEAHIFFSLGTTLSTLCQKVEQIIGDVSIFTL